MLPPGRKKGKGTTARRKPLSVRGLEAFQAFDAADGWGKPFSRSSFHKTFTVNPRSGRHGPSRGTARSRRRPCSGRDDAAVRPPPQLRDGGVPRHRERRDRGRNSWTMAIRARRSATRRERFRTICGPLARRSPPSWTLHASPPTGPSHAPGRPAAAVAEAPERRLGPTSNRLPTRSSGQATRLPRGGPRWASDFQPRLPTAAHRRMEIIRKC